MNSPQVRSGHASGTRASPFSSQCSPSLSIPVDRQYIDRFAAMNRPSAA